MRHLNSWASLPQGQQCDMDISYRCHSNCIINKTKFTSIQYSSISHKPHTPNLLGSHQLHPLSTKQLPQKDSIINTTLILPSKQLPFQRTRRSLRICRPGRRIIRTRRVFRVRRKPSHRIGIPLTCFSKLLYLRNIVSPTKDDSARDLAVVLGAHAAGIWGRGLLAFQEAGDIGQCSFVGCDEVDSWCGCYVMDLCDTVARDGAR